MKKSLLDTLWEFNIAMERSTIFLMGQSTISMAIFNSYVSHYQRVIKTSNL